MLFIMNNYCCGRDRYIDLVENLKVCTICGDCLMGDNFVYSSFEKQIVYYKSENSYNCYIYFQQYIDKLFCIKSYHISNKILSHFKNSLNFDGIHRILKAKRLNQYYIHINLINNIVNNISLPNISNEVIEIFKIKFNLFSKNFYLIFQDKRKNLIKFSFILFKFCQESNNHHLIKYIVNIPSSYKKLKFYETVYDNVMNY